MKEILQSIFFVQDKKELIMPLLMCVLLISSAQSVLTFMKIGNGGGNPQCRTIQLINFTINIVILAIDIIAITVHWFFIKETVAALILTAIILIPIIIVLFLMLLSFLSEKIYE